MISPDQFTDLIDRRLGELFGEFGLEEVGGEDFHLRFAGALVFVIVAYEPDRSHELTIWIGRVDDDAEPPLELADALRATDCPPDQIEALTLMQSADPDALERMLDRAGRLIPEYATPFPRGDDAAFAQAWRIRSDRASLYTNQLATGQVIADADKAWNDGDYLGVYRGLRPIEETLDRTHRRRLEFAQEQIAVAAENEEAD